MPVERALSPATIAVTAGRPSDAGDPLNQPIVLASNFRAGGEYTRTHGTDTWAALEAAIGALEGGRAIAFASGMAAAAAIVYALAPKVVVIPTFSYLGVRSLLSEYQLQGHVELRPVDITDTAAVAAAAAGVRRGVGRDTDQPDARCRRSARDRCGVATLPARAWWSTRRSPRHCCSGRSNMAPPSCCTAGPSSSVGTATC